MTQDKKTWPKPAKSYLSPGEGCCKNQDSFDRGVPLPCDLHIHTQASDGSFPASEIVEIAVNMGLRAIAICDHDTVSGVSTLPQLVFPDFQIVPGVEINCQFQEREVHILGYFIPLKESPFLRFMEELRRERYERIKAIVERLKRLGKPLELDQVLSLSKGDSIGRPHVAEAMVKSGYVSSVKEAFHLYLGIGKKAYVDRKRLSPEDSVRIIRESGGVPVWAHPGTAEADSILERLLDAGLLGLEVYHPEHDFQTQEKYLQIAGKRGLLATGGSDFHGPYASEGGKLGECVVPFEVVKQLMKLSKRE